MLFSFAMTSTFWTQLLTFELKPFIHTFGQSDVRQKDKKDKKKKRQKRKETKRENIAMFQFINDDDDNNSTIITGQCF